MKSLYCLILSAIILFPATLQAQSKKVLKGLAKSEKLISKEKYYKAETSLQKLEKKIPETDWNITSLAKKESLWSFTTYKSGQAKKTYIHLNRGAELLADGYDEVMEEDRLPIENRLFEVGLNASDYIALQALVNKSKPVEELSLFTLPHSVVNALLKVQYEIDQGYLADWQSKESFLTLTQQDAWELLNDKSFLNGLQRNELILIREVWVQSVYLNARLKVVKGWYEPALEFLEKNRETADKLTSKVSPWYARYLVEMANLYERTGDKKKAVKMADKAISEFKKVKKEYDNEAVYARLLKVKNLSDQDKDRKSENEEADLQKVLKYYNKKSKNQVLTAQYIANFYTNRNKGKFRKAARGAESLINYLKVQEYVFNYNKLIIEDLQSYFQQTGDYQTADEISGFLLGLADSTLAPNAPRKTIQSVDHQFDKMTFLFLQPSKEVLSSNVKNTLIDNYGKDHYSYSQWLQLKVGESLSENKFDEALKIMQEQMAIAKTQSGRNSEAYADALLAMIDISLTQGKFETARDSLASLKIILDGLDDPLIQNIKAGYYSGLLEEMMGDYEKAEKTFKRTFSKIAKTERKSDLFINLDPELKASVFLFSGDYKEAEKILDKAYKRKAEIYGEDAFPLSKTFYLYSKLYLNMGNIPDAKKYARKAEGIIAKRMGEQSILGTQIRELQAELDISVGDYELAQKKLEKNYKDEQKIFGKDHFKPAKTNIKLSGVNYAYTGEAKENLANTVRSTKILADVFGYDHPDVARAIVQQAQLNLALSNAEIALALADSAFSVFEAYDKKHPELPEVMMLKADALTALGKPIESSDVLFEGQKLAESMFNKNHPLVLTLKSKRAFALLQAGEENGLEDFAEVIKERELFLQKDFLFLTQREKQKFYTTMQKELLVYPYALMSFTSKPEKQYERLLMNRMIAKGILLKSKTDFEQDVLSTGDNALIADLELWREARGLYTKKLMEQENDASQKDELAAIFKKSEELENSLLEKVYAGKKKRSGSVGVKDIQKGLEDDEVLIEIIRTADLKGEAIYYALVVTPKNIELVKFEDGAKIEGKDYKYLRNVLKLGAKDKRSYKYFWEPIASKIPEDAKKIYFSPDGIFNLINPEVIKRPDDSYLISHYRFIRLTNPVDILTYKEEKETGVNRREALLIGNPQFYADGVGAVWPTLPGAESEVIQVSEKLGSNGWTKTQLLQNNAIEDTLKATKNPTVLHIATHGYFKNASSSMVSEGQNSGSFSLAQNPLVMSGLLFTNGGESYEKNGADGSAEGVFTALEAQNLALNKCELVVLSACETGLGSVSVGNGVYGLQKAFLDAGATNVLMTLQKVNDQVTEELMLDFYDHYLAGDSEEEALYKAKMAVMKNHPHPKYWGPFILVQ